MKSPILAMAYLLTVMYMALSTQSLITLLILFLSSSVPAFAAGRTWITYMKYSLITVLFIILFNYILMGSSSLIFSFAMALSLLSITSAFAVFSALVDFEELIMILEKMKIPQKITIAMALSLRFLPVMQKEAAQLKESLLARGANFKSAKLKERISAHTPILATLFLLALERSVRVAEALELHGFPSDRRNPWIDLHICSRDALILSIILIDAALFTLQLFSITHIPQEILAMAPALLALGGCK